MADPVQLDPRQYTGTYKLIGGAPALDFANLVSYRGTDREHDWLEPFSNIHRWAAAAGLDAPVAGGAAELRGLREVIVRVFLAVAEGRTPGPNDIDSIGARAAGAWARRRLRFPRGAAAARWADPAPSLVTELALNAADLLTSDDSMGRIAACDECRWLFLDTTRNRSRRWCDPADCGNRARQRRHYRRHARAQAR